MTVNHERVRLAMIKVGDDLERERLARIAYRDHGAPLPDRMLCAPVPRFMTVGAQGRPA